MNDLKVIKRDGLLEDFNPEKIERVMRAAGMNEEQSKLVVGSIVSWVTSLGIHTVSSLKIRDTVFDEMKKLNKSAASLFAWYQQTKEKK